MDDPAWQGVFSNARSEDSVVRGQATEALGAIGTEQAVGTLRELVYDPDFMVRFKASVELAWRGDQAGVSVLIWALGRKELCFMALEALTELGSEAALKDVQRFFQRWRVHPLEKLQAAAVLHRSGDARGTDYLKAKIDSSRPEERGFALELLGRLKMPGALNLLMNVLSDPEDSHRLDAARGLGLLADTRSLPLLERISRQIDDELLAELAGEIAVGIRQQQHGSSKKP